MDKEILEESNEKFVVLVKTELNIKKNKKQDDTIPSCTTKSRCRCAFLPRLMLSGQLQGVLPLAAVV